VLPALILFTCSKAVHALRWKVFESIGTSHIGLLGIFLVHNMANAVLLLRAATSFVSTDDVAALQHPALGADRHQWSWETLDGLAFVVLVALAFSLGAIPGVAGDVLGQAGLALVGAGLG
jgi:hypothetical protein